VRAGPGEPCFERHRRTALWSLTDSEVDALLLDAASANPVTAPIAGDARSGAAPVEQAVQAVAALPVELDPDCRAEAVAAMRGHARSFDPVQLARVGQRLVTVVDPHSGDTLLAVRLEREERTAARRRDFTIGSPQGGLVRGRFLLPAADAAVVVTARRPLAAPRPAGASGGADPWQDPVAAAAPTARDDRTDGPRMADAFVELCDRALFAGDLPETGGERPQLVVTVDLDRLRARPVPANCSTARRSPRPHSAGLPATAVSSRPYSAAPDSRSTSAGRPGSSPPTSAARSFSAIADARFPSATDRRPGATSGCPNAHHLRHWADGGPTSLGNLISCRTACHGSQRSTRPWLLSGVPPRSSGHRRSGRGLEGT